MDHFDGLHSELRKNVSWYDKWHAYADSGPITWLLFVVIAAAVTLVLLDEIEDVVPPDSLVSALGSVKKEKTSGQNELSEVSGLTGKALRLSQKHARGTSDEKQAAIEELTHILTERRERIQEAARTDPGSLKGILMNEEARESFPEEVQSLLETPFEESGTYRIALVTTHMHDPSQGEALTGSHEEGYEEYILETDEGERYQLALTTEEAYRLRPETIVTVSGVDIGDDIIIATEPLHEGDWDGDGEVLGASTVKRVAVIAFNFRNSSAEPLTETQIRERVFTATTSVRTYVREVSYGQWEIQGRDTPEGDVYGWVTIPADANGSCDYSGWATKANQELSARGISLTGYTNIQYVFPGTNTGCNWSGLAYLSGQLSWVKAESIGAYVSGHELGHNFGFHHAGKYNCTVATNSSPSTCVSNEYGDPYDIMGSSPKHTNNYNKARYWLSPDQIQTITGSGTYTVEPLETISTGVKLLRIKRPFTSSLGSYADGYYHIEMRTADGVFGSYLSTDPALRGVLVRLVGDYAVGGKRTFYVRTLLPGESLVDSEAGLTVSLESISAANASVRVTMGEVACIRNAPTVSASPSAHWVAAGTLAPYTVTVTNNDSDSCTPSNFALTLELPAGFTASPENIALTVAPQGSVNATVNVLSALGIEAGTYPIAVRSTHEHTNASGESILNYNVIVNDTLSPEVAIASPTEGTALSGSRFDISASATDTSGVARIDIMFDGSVVHSCTNVAACSYSMSTRKISTGTHTVEAVATDSSAYANKGSASVTVVLEGSASGGSGGKTNDTTTGPGKGNKR